MNVTLVKELYEEINALPIVDIHTHVNWKTGTARNIGEILSYHYYTELTNSARLRWRSACPLTIPRELTRLVYPKLEYIRNTVQYDWLMTISREFLGIEAQEWEIDDNWEAIFDRSVEVMDRPGWAEELIAQADIVRVFLTNQYDEDLEGLDTSFLRALPAHRALCALDGPRSGSAGAGPFPGPEHPHRGDFRAVIARTFEKFVAPRHGVCSHVHPDEL